MEYSQVNKTLLSAYIDGNVSDEERILVETAVENEPQTAWELDTLQQTVYLLNSLSKADVPSFVELPKSLMLKKLYATKPFPKKFQAAQQIFWQIGNPFWRNIAIASLLLLITILSGDLLFSLTPNLYHGFPLIVAAFLETAQSGLASMPSATETLNIDTLNAGHLNIGVGIQRSYLLFIYLGISSLTFMSTMLWWRSRPFH